jgi:hypothetical protein
MKLRHAISALATPLLSLSIAISASSLAAAQETGATTPAQRDRTTTTLPDNSSTTQRAQGHGQGHGNAAEVGENSRQSAPHDPATPGAHECAEGAPGLADNQNAQGGNPQANTNAQGSRAQQNQSEQGAVNSNAQIAQAGDDCLPSNTNRGSNENARGQGTGNTSGNNSSTNNAGGNSSQTRDTDD